MEGIRKERKKEVREGEEVNAPQIYLTSIWEWERGEALAKSVWELILTFCQFQK